MLDETIEKTLAEAEAFAAKDMDAEAYYKHVRAILQILELVGREGFNAFKPGSTTKNREYWLVRASDAFSKAEDELTFVLDLAEGEAEERFDARIVTDRSDSEGEGEGGETDQKISMAGLQLKKSPAVQDAYSINKDPTDDQANGGVGEPEFGPDVEQSSKEETSLPQIPLSPLDAAQCQFYYEMQVAVQKLEGFAGALAKYQSNAVFLRNLGELLERFQTLVKQEKVLGVALEKSRGLYVSDIPATELAKQITLLQMDILKRIQEHELLVPAEQRPYLAPNLYNLLSLSKFICHWTQYEILRYGGAAKREMVLGHLIRVAHCLVAMGNFEGAKAVIGGLTATPIRRLSCSTNLNRRLHNKLDSLETLFSERRNFAQLRDTLASTVAPCIPYMGLYLRGLDDRRFSHFQASAYRELFPTQAVVQHYLLTQPFRWEEELYAISKLRQPIADLVSDSVSRMPDQLTRQELERLSFGEADHFDRMRWGLQRSENFAPSPSHSVYSPSPSSIR